MISKILLSLLFKLVSNFDWLFKLESSWENFPPRVGAYSDYALNRSFIVNNRLNSSKEAMHFMKSVEIRSNFWSVFSRIQTEYGKILRISPYSVQMRENTDRKLLRIWTLFSQWIKATYIRQFFETLQLLINLLVRFFSDFGIFVVTNQDYFYYYFYYCNFLR